MSADGGAITGVLRAVRGAAQRDRIEACAVRGLDHRFIGAGLPAPLVVSAVAVHPVPGDSGAGNPDDDHGLSSAMAGAAATGSESAEDDDVYARSVQPDLREYAGRADAILLFLEPARRRPAVHTQPRVPTIARTCSDMSSSDSIETTAATIDQAISQALSELGAEQDDVTIEVLSTPRSGVLGRGARQARVRVTKRAREGAHSGVMSPPPAPPLRATPPEMRRPEERPEPPREPARQERIETARDVRSDSPREPRREAPPRREEGRGGDQREHQRAAGGGGAPREDRREPERNEPRSGPRPGRGNPPRQEARPADGNAGGESGRGEEASLPSGNREGRSRGRRGRGGRRQQQNSAPR